MLACRCLCGHSVARRCLKIHSQVHYRRQPKLQISVSSFHDNHQRKTQNARLYLPTLYFKSKYLICNFDLYSQSNPNSILYRCIQSSISKSKEESKIEQTVKALKEQAAEAHLKASNEKVFGAEPEKSIIQPKKKLWLRVTDEIKHYYHGFRLMFIDIKISIRLLWKLLKGTTLSRREHKQLVRTTADLFRLVPFLVFIVVPFMEFLLPVAVKLFPNMLPSTFTEKHKEHEKMKKNLKVKLEMAKFLQDTIMESAVRSKTKKNNENMVQEFSNFMNQIRSSGMQTSTKEILKFSKLFEDEITLDNLSRLQLQALCRVLMLPVIGTDNFLRFQLRMRLRQLKTDDKMIQKEGVDSLTIWELQAACRARGMRSLGVPETRLKFQLEQWLELHLKENIPTSLLLLSRALYLSENLSTTDQLQATLSSLPETTTQEAKIKIAEISGEKVDNKAKFQLIKQEEAAIKKEIKDMEAEEQQQEKEKKAVEIAAKHSDDVLEDKAKVLVDKAVPLETPPVAASQPPPTEEVITNKDLEIIESALEEIAHEKQLSIEQEELQDLKEEVDEYKEDVEDLKEVILSTGGSLKDLKESKASERLMKHVHKLISQADSINQKLFQEKVQLLEQIEVSEVRVKRSTELKDDVEKMDKVMKDISLKKDNLISINEIVLALKRLQKVPDETRAQMIVEVLDEDKDGKVDISLALKTIEHLTRDNLKLNPSQVTEVLDLLKKESVWEEEEKIMEKLAKDKERAKSQTPLDDEMFVTEEEQPSKKAQQQKS
ncbi:mitochondrial proton/calcium exchanger protein-like [Argonauta hians]